MPAPDELLPPLKALRIAARTLSAAAAPEFARLWAAAYAETLRARHNPARYTERAVDACRPLVDLARPHLAQAEALHAVAARLRRALHPPPPPPPIERARPTIRMGSRGARR